MMTVDEVKQALEIATDQDLAARAGRKASAVSNWRKAGEVPATVLVALGLLDKKGEKETPQVPEHLRHLHSEIDRVVLGGKSVADQYDLTAKILKKLQELAED